MCYSVLQYRHSNYMQLPRTVSTMIAKDARTVIAASLIAVAILSLSGNAAFAEETRDEKIQRLGEQAERIRDTTNTTRTDTQDSELDAIIREMNKLGIPTQGQADENPEYWILRSHYAEEEARQNTITSVMYDLVQSLGAPYMKFQLGMVILVIGSLSAMIVLVFRRMCKKGKQDPTSII